MDAQVTQILFPQVNGEKMEVDRQEVPLYVSASLFSLVEYLNSAICPSSNPPPPPSLSLSRSFALSSVWGSQRWNPRQEGFSLWGIWSAAAAWLCALRDLPRWTCSPDGESLSICVSSGACLRDYFFTFTLVSPQSIISFTFLCFSFCITTSVRMCACACVCVFKTWVGHSLKHCQITGKHYVRLHTRIVLHHHFQKGRGARPKPKACESLLAL